MRNGGAAVSDYERSAALTVIRELLINKGCSCGGWDCPRCAMTVEDARRLVPDLRDNIDLEAADEPTWPGGISDGLTLPCADCGEVPRFDYQVDDEFWHRHVAGPAHLGVVCLPCLDRRCGGVGLSEALREVQWTGTGHTVVLDPSARYGYGVRP